MSEEIIRTIADRISRCSVCQRKHVIQHFSHLSESEKSELRQVECHLGFLYYQGSLIREKENTTIDVFANPITYNKVMIDLIEEAKKTEPAWNYGKPEGVTDQQWQMELIQEADEDDEGF